MNPLNGLLRYSGPVNFEVHGDTSHAVERLSRLADKPVLQATFSGEPSKPSLVGSATKDRVRLHKVTPLFGNAFKPIFVGSFKSESNKTSLVGTFEMGPVGKVVTSIFVLFTLGIQILLLPGLSTDGIAIFQPLLFLIGGIIFLLAIKAYSKRDVSWIRKEIEAALG